MFSKKISQFFSASFWKEMYQELQLIWLLMGDSAVPVYWKVLPVLVAGYLVSPIDLIPGFIPVLGQLDDVSLVLLALNVLPKLAPDARVAVHRDRLGLSAAA